MVELGSKEHVRSQSMLPSRSRKRERVKEGTLTHNIELGRFFGFCVLVTKAVLLQIGSIFEDRTISAKRSTAVQRKIRREAPKVQ
jgi:hypothetical protein